VLSNCGASGSGKGLNVDYKLTKFIGLQTPQIVQFFSAPNCVLNLDDLSA